MSETGAILGTHRVAGAEAIDWEDIAVGPGPRRHESYLFVGDIGSNFQDREYVTVYRFPEPSVPGGETSVANVDALRLRYPSGTVDAEALLVDPVSGDLYILTKETGRSRVMRAPRKHLRTTGVITLEDVGSFEVGPDYPVDPARGRVVPASPLPGTLVTAADVSPDGTTILVRTYQEVLAFSRDPKAPLQTAFASPPCLASQRDEPQGEAVGFAADGCAYYTIGELVAAPLHRFGPVEGGCP